MQKPQTEPDETKGRLRFWHGLEGVAIAVFWVFMFGLSLFALSSLGLNLQSWEAMLLQTLVTSSIFLGSALFVPKMLKISCTEAICFGPVKKVEVALAVTGVVPAGILCDQMASWLHRLKPEVFSTDSMMGLSDVLIQSPFYAFIILAVVLSLFPAVGEEAMFRGLVLRSFKQDMPSYFAVIYSSFLFGLVHFDWLQGTAAAALGIYLAFTVIVTGSLVPAIFGHMVNNLTWCITVRYSQTNFETVLEKGYSTSFLVICLLVTLASVVSMVWISGKTQSS